MREGMVRTKNEEGPLCLSLMLRSLQSRMAEADTIPVLLAQFLVDSDSREAYALRHSARAFQPLRSTAVGKAPPSLRPRTSLMASLLSAAALGCSEEQHTRSKPTEPGDTGLKLLNSSE